MKEIAKRAAEAGAGLAAAAQAAATQNFVANQTAHRRRVEDSHRHGMKLLGMQDDDFAKSEDETVGDVIVTGDVYGDEAVKMFNRAGSQEAAPTPEAPAAAPGLLAKVAPLILAGAIGATGMGGIALLVASLGEKAAEELLIDTDTQRTLDLVSDDE
jgi:hypothetical protein